MFSSSGAGVGSGAGPTRTPPRKRSLEGTRKVEDVSWKRTRRTPSKPAIHCITSLFKQVGSDPGMVALLDGFKLVNKETFLEQGPIDEQIDDRFLISPLYRRVPSEGKASSEVQVDGAAGSATLFDEDDLELVEQSLRMTKQRTQERLYKFFRAIHFSVSDRNTVSFRENEDAVGYELGPLLRRYYILRVIRDKTRKIYRTLSQKLKHLDRSAQNPQKLQNRTLFYEKLLPMVESSLQGYVDTLVPKLKQQGHGVEQLYMFEDHILEDVKTELSEMWESAERAGEAAAASVVYVERLSTLETTWALKGFTRGGSSPVKVKTPKRTIKGAFWEYGIGTKNHIVVSEDHDRHAGGETFKVWHNGHYIGTGRFIRDKMIISFRQADGQDKQVKKYLQHILDGANDRKVHYERYSQGDCCIQITPRGEIAILEQSVQEVLGSRGESKTQ